MTPDKYGKPGRTLVLACGALVKELQAVVAINQLEAVTIECLPAELHNRPDEIPDLLRQRLSERAGDFDRVLVGYADCGTGGRIDTICEEFGVERLPGAHCYQFFATSEVFDQLHEAELGTFYLTDFLARHFEVFVIDHLGIGRRPELVDIYFANYTRLVYLAQLDDPDLSARAEAAAERLGLRYERRQCGYGELESTMVDFVGRVPAGGQRW